MVTHITVTYITFFTFFLQENIIKRYIYKSCCYMWRHTNGTITEQIGYIQLQFNFPWMMVTLITRLTITLTHWGRVTHICVGKLTIIGSDNGLSPGRHQAIIWGNAGILLIGPLETNFSEILIEIDTFSFNKNAFENGVCEMASILSRS